MTLRAVNRMSQRRTDKSVRATSPLRVWFPRPNPSDEIDERRRSAKLTDAGVDLAAVIRGVRRKLQQRFAEGGWVRGEAGAFGEVDRPRQRHFAVDGLGRKRRDVARRKRVEIAAEFADGIEASKV